MNPETPDFKRLFLAVFLMTALLMAYNALFAPKPGTKPPEKAESVQQPVPASQETVSHKKELRGPSKENLSKPIVTKELSHAAQDVSKLRDGYQAVFSSAGARVQDYWLTGYQDRVTLTPNLSISSRDPSLTLFKDTHYQLEKTDPDEVVFRYLTPENVRVTKKHHFSKKAFVLDSEVEFLNQSQSLQAISIDLNFDTLEQTSPEEDQLAVSIRHGNEHQRVPYSDLVEQPQIFKGSVEYAGFDRRYFFMSVAPKGFAETESATAFAYESSGKKGLQIKLSQKTALLKPGESKKFIWSSYLGPKELLLLQEAGHQLEENIDYGWFGVLSRPLLWLLVWINQWVMNFGISIILLTIFIKLVTFPLTQKSFMAQQEMKKIQPALKELQKKYAHDKAALGQKQMAFYKENGVNPMAGCLPILIQMPVWFALYQMLGNSVELYEQPFYSWITDLTKPDPYYVLPVTMGLSMLISQLIIQPPVDESQPQMKYVMWFMPIFLTFIMLSLPAGLSLYMLVNNLLTIVQQVHIKRQYGI